MISLLTTGTANLLYGYAGTCWLTTASHEIAVRDPFVRLDKVAVMVLRYQEIQAAQGKHAGRRFLSSPLFFLQPRLDRDYRLQLKDCVRHADISLRQNWSPRDAALGALLQHTIFAAAQTKDRTALPTQPRIWLARSKRLVPTWGLLSRKAAAKQFSVAESELTQKHLECYWASQTTTQWGQSFYAQELLVGTGLSANVEAWVDLRTNLGCDYPWPNPAWDELRTNKFLSADTCNAKADAEAGDLVEIWRNGMRTILDEHGLVPAGTKLDAAKVFELQKLYTEQPQLAGAVWRDYLEILVTQPAPKPEWKATLATLENGQIPPTLLSVATMPKILAEPREVDGRLLHVAAGIRRRLGRWSAAVTTEDLFAAIAAPSRPLRLAKILRPSAFHYHGLPSKDSLCWSSPIGDYDLFTGPGRPELDPVEPRLGGLARHDRESATAGND